MISISNADRDKAVELLRAYADLIKQHGMRTSRQFNTRRMALNLAKKIARKPAPGYRHPAANKQQQ